jgi:hypothetical protein
MIWEQQIELNKNNQKDDVINEAIGEAFEEKPICSRQ